MPLHSSRALPESLPFGPACQEAERFLLTPCLLRLGPYTQQRQLTATRPAAHAMKLSESTWSPFQSSEVREICAHLTATERARLLDDARQRGLQIGSWTAVPFGIVCALSAWLPRRLGLVLLPSFAVYFAVWGLPRLRAMRRRTTELLCQTEWARSQGYIPDRLRLMTFPWSR